MHPLAGSQKNSPWRISLPTPFSPFVPQHLSREPLMAESRRMLCAFKAEYSLVGFVSTRPPARCIVE